jgi:transposase
MRHKRSHTAVTVDEMGRQGFVKTVGTTTQDHLRLLKWAVSLAEERLWAIEDCRHLTRRLERDLTAAGESMVRVSPKLMAHVRDSARSYGKSDPIDALAVARAALREPNLPTARLDGVEREIRLLVDHREDLVAERTRIISRLRWHLHELDPGWTAPTKLERHSAFDKVAPSLLAIVGCGALGVAKIIGNSPRRPVPFQRRLRASQRHRAATGVVVEQTTASFVTHRQSATQRRTNTASP